MKTLLHCGEIYYYIRMGIKITPKDVSRHTRFTRNSNAESSKHTLNDEK